jgi:hypothetical protein
VTPVIVITQPVYRRAAGLRRPYWAYTLCLRATSPNVRSRYYNYDALWIEGTTGPAPPWGYYPAYWVPERACCGRR